MAAAAPLIVRGEVGHTRHHPRVHAFRYRSAYVALPLMSMGPTAEGRLGPLRAWGLNRRALLTIASQDHAAQGASLTDWAQQQLCVAGLERLAKAATEIWLVAFPRVLGYAFKPVSFYLVEDTDGRVGAVIAEVHNTFGQTHVYVLPVNGPLQGQTLGCDKAFYVSPFFPVQGRYEFRLFWSADVGSRQVFRIDYWDGDKQMLSTHMGGKALPLTARNALAAFISLPWQSLTITLRIHWQALLLWIKGMTFFSRSTTP